MSTRDGDRIARGRWLMAGAADARDDTPGLRMPILSDKARAAYWRGFKLGGGTR